jgi:3-deoxy-D-manno-octulosonate 8-phosphate phosphatase (KDO 8-P phosphatase)
MVVATVPHDALERARRVKLLILDCDGVLTDGRIILLPDGGETKTFDAKDGHGLRMAGRSGLRIAIISGRESFAVRERARDLGITRLYEKAIVKLEPYERLLQEEQLTDADVCFIGDDVTDIPLFRRVGLAVAVADATNDAKRFAHMVTERPGGRGAVREMVEFILKAQDKWDEAIARYE